ncbi:MAG: DUF4124 domain-containing protein [Guyparkeria sp.]|uniref:DUF4124 domain-containing protein n=1 Tax=Guyparkeria sp. TaxID=2035736 RepID=UPI003978419B
MQGIAAQLAPLGTPSTRNKASSGRRLAVAGLAVVAVIMLALTHQPVEAATIYKSVDERGNVQFSQTPPKDRPSEEVDAVGTPEPNEPPKIDESPSEEEPESSEGDPSDPATETKVVDREKARETCRQAREQRESVANSGNQLMVRDEDGKYQPMSEEQRKERLKRLDAIIEEACSAAEE